MSAMFPTVNFLINASSVGVLWLGAESGRTRATSRSARWSRTSRYLVQILMSVVMATFMISMIPRASVSADRIQEVLDTAAERRPARRPGARRRRSTAHSSSATSASTTRAPSTRCSPASRSPPRPGQTTAIVGSTGAGKTTLVNLILRLFDSTEGTVLVGGVDVHDLDPDVLWSTIGLVPQRPYLFSGTVASNLQFGKPDATEEEMWAALEVAQATDFVRAMPGGLDGADRAGRHQRVGRAAPAAVDRACARSAGPTSTCSTTRSRRSTSPPTRGCGPRSVRTPNDAAVVIVAQRVSTIATADNILVLEDGVVDRARHARRAHARLPDLRRDRPVPDRREERGMTAHRRLDDARRRGARPRGARDPRRRPVELRGRSGRAVEGLQERRCAAWAGCSARMWIVLVRRRGRRDHQRGAQRARAPRRSAHATDIIVSGVTSDRRHRLRRAAPRAARGGRAVRRRRPCCRSSPRYLLAGVMQRLMFRLRSDVEDKVNALPLSYIDKQQRGDLLSRVTNDIDNVAQSLQQTLSQMLTSVLLLIGCRDHDVHDLAAAGGGRAHDGAGLGVGDAVGRAPGPAAVHLAVDEHRHPQRADRGDLHRPRRGEGVRSPARGRAAVPRHQRRALRVVVRRAVHVEPDAALHDVHGQRPVRASSPSSAACGCRAARSRVGDIQAFIQYSRNFSMPLTQLASMMNVFQSGIASFERVVEFLDAEEQSPDPVDERRPAAGARPRRVPRRHVLLRPRPAAHRVALAASPSPARPSRSSGRPARARPRSSTSSCGSTS